ncbi:MAG: nucleoporin [Rhodospirillales bacterium]|nr:nucleoporin [Rhodospirillales bacterium]
MKKAWRPVLLSTALALLSACAQNGVLPAFFDGCPADSRERVEEANWEKARTIAIRIRQNEFEPMVFRLVQDRPYVLVIDNKDESLHFFHAQKFFRSIALAEVTSGEQMFIGGCTAAVAVEPQKSAELRFVAVRNGRYDFEDNPFLFSFVRLGSASGSISIEPEKIYYTKSVIPRVPKPTTKTPVAPVRTTPLEEQPAEPGEGLFGAPSPEEEPAKPDEGLFGAPSPEEEPAEPDEGLFGAPSPEEEPAKPDEGLFGAPSPEEPPAKPDDGLFGAPPPEEPPAKSDEGLFDTPIKPPAAPEDRAPGKPGEGLFGAPIGKPPTAPG